MSLKHRVDSLERTRRPQELLFACVTPDEYGAMIRDACERALEERGDERTRVLVETVLSAKDWPLVQKELDELDLSINLPGTAVVAPKESASFEEWLRHTGQ